MMGHWQKQTELWVEPINLGRRIPPDQDESKGSVRAPVQAEFCLSILWLVFSPKRSITLLTVILRSPMSRLCLIQSSRQSSMF